MTDRQPTPASGYAHVARGMCRGGLSMLLAATAFAAAARAGDDEPLAMQAPGAWSVATSTNLADASQTLFDRFEGLSADGRQLTTHELRAAAAEEGGTDAAERTRDAARFFLSSPVARRLAESGGKTGAMTRGGLRIASDAATSPDLERRMLAFAVDKDNSRAVAALLRDPGVPNAARTALLSRFDDDDVLRMFGRPVVKGDGKDVRDVTAAFVYLVRLSWLGAAEADAIVHYKVAYRMLRGMDDKSASFWNGREVMISQKMLMGDADGVDAKGLARHIGIFAHESGHAIYKLSGLQDRFEAEMARRGVATPMNGIVNEAVAGVFQNRAGVAARGYGTNEDGDANLAFLHDIEKNIVDDRTMYARYYHVDVVKAHAQLFTVKQLVADDLIPALQDKFALLGDPQLAAGLPLRHD